MLILLHTLIFSANLYNLAASDLIFVCHLSYLE